MDRLRLPLWQMTCTVWSLGTPPSEAVMRLIGARIAPGT
jgi:hypothetical protein